MKIKNKTKNIVLTALFTAIIFILSRLAHIPLPDGGIIHVADAFIFLSACILPWPYAMFAGAAGAGLTNLTAAHLIMFFPATIIIKPLYVPFFGRKSVKIITVRNIIATVIAGMICVIGYYLWWAVGIPDAGFIGALPKIPGLAIQAVASVVVFIMAGYAFDRANIKKILAYDSNTNELL